jgi:hypothetical protein
MTFFCAIFSSLLFEKSKNLELDPELEFIYNYGSGSGRQFELATSKPYLSFCEKCAKTVHIKHDLTWHFFPPISQLISGYFI